MASYTSLGAERSDVSDPYQKKMASLRETGKVVADPLVFKNGYWTWQFDPKNPLGLLDLFNNKIRVQNPNLTRIMSREGWLDNRTDVQVVVNELAQIEGLLLLIDDKIVAPKIAIPEDMYNLYMKNLSIYESLLKKAQTKKAFITAREKSMVFVPLNQAPQTPAGTNGGSDGGTLPSSPPGGKKPPFYPPDGSGSNLDHLFNRDWPPKNGLKDGTDYDPKPLIGVAAAVLGLILLTR